MSDNKTSIIVAVIGLIGIIAAAVIGAKWGKDNFNIVVKIDGKDVILKDEDVEKMASENESLRKEILENEKKVENLQRESKDLEEKLGVANGELDDVPVIEFQNYGLSIDGEEKIINKDKSCVAINGRQYYSQDFIDNLLPENKNATKKDDIIYIGRIIKEKTNLFKRQIIDNTSDAYISEDVKDTYGNLHSESLIFKHTGNSITFNANREYSNLKCTLAVEDGCSGGGVIQIETDEGIVFTSEELLNSTEPFKIDVPINQASTITIKSIGDCTWSYLMVADGVLYNEE